MSNCFRRPCIKGQIGGVVTEMRVDSWSSVSFIQAGIMSLSQAVSQLLPTLQYNLWQHQERRKKFWTMSEPQWWLHSWMSHMNLWLSTSLLLYSDPGNWLLPKTSFDTWLFNNPSQYHHHWKGVSAHSGKEQWIGSSTGNCIHWAKAKLYIIAAVENITAKDAVDDCTTAQFGRSPLFESPKVSRQILRHLVKEYKELFRVQRGRTSTGFHYIPNNGPPICVPPHWILAHYS